MAKRSGHPFFPVVLCKLCQGVILLLNFECVIFQAPWPRTSLLYSNGDEKSVDLLKHLLHLRRNHLLLLLAVEGRAEWYNFRLPLFFVFAFMDDDTEEERNDTRNNYKCLTKRHPTWGHYGKINTDFPYSVLSRQREYLRCTFLSFNRSDDSSFH